MTFPTFPATGLVALPSGGTRKVPQAQMDVVCHELGLRFDGIF